MEFQDMTLKQAAELVAIFNGSQSTAPFSPHIGKQCIFRTYASGVHYGTLVKQDGRQIEIKNSRRLWKWHAKNGISLSEVSQSGIDQSKSRICAEVPEITITDCLEIIPCSIEAIGTIEQAPVASK